MKFDNQKLERLSELVKKSPVIDKSEKEDIDDLIKAVQYIGHPDFELKEAIANRRYYSMVLRILKELDMTETDEDIANLFERYIK